MNKLSKILLTSIATLSLSFTSSSFASVTHDTCTDLPGSWSGKAELQFFVFNCEYESNAVVSEGNHTTANVKITKTSGNILCPRQEEQTVNVTCHNGRVEMKDSKIDVAGDMADDGQSAILEGSLHALFRYHPFKLSVTKNS